MPAIRRLISLQLGILVVFAFGSATPAADGIDFNRDIRPIVSGVCVACHGPDESAREAGLRLDTFEGATTDLGGYSAIVPGDVSASEIITRITSDDADIRMPPPGKGRELTEAEVALLKQWIESGAEYDEHWSYQAPVRSALPQVQQSEWVSGPIDQFILATLNAKGLSPSPPADRQTLGRRVALTLTGLPPTQEEIEAFLADGQPDAYEKFVDAQLRKPAFGERWARVWLDLARYADSAGYADDPARTIWAYRDYVIKSLNDNKPFDQFTIEQLAGDLLDSPSNEQLIATAFHRNTMTNNEGGTNDEQFRNEAVVDRVNTTFAVWMGTTMACAQCHTHKYDPITQEEYFQVFDIFNQTQDADRRDESPLLEIWTDQQELTKSEIKQQIAELQAKLGKQTPELDQAFHTWLESLTTPPTWQTLLPTSVDSTAGQLAITGDGTVRIEGERPDKAIYGVNVAITEPTTVSAIQLQVPEAQTSNFVLSRISAQYRPNLAKLTATRFVRVVLPGQQKFLHLAEVEIFEAGKNVAPTGSATQSSTYSNSQASRAIDGNSDGDYYKNSVSHTEGEDSPWLLIDLGRTAAIDSIVIWNRTDGGQAILDRLAGYEIELLDDTQKLIERIVPAEVPAPSFEVNFSGARPVRFVTAMADYAQPSFPAADAILTESGKAAPADDKGWAVGGGTGKAHELTLVLQQPMAFEPGELRIELQQISKFGQHVLTEFQFGVTADPNTQQWAAMPAEIRQLVLKNERDATETEKLINYYRSISPLLDAERSTLAAAEKRLAEMKPETTVPIFRELPGNRTRETHVQLRGSYQSLGDKVLAGVPKVFHPIEYSTEEKIDRLAFARWLVDKKNPLTARVVVNRHWEQVFGVGIVETSEEFGAQGELPSHPELLDWLALELVESGWDLKHLLKQMVMSSTYRQSSHVGEESLAADPDNRYYSRGPRFRVSAEMVRDQTLAVAGLLSDKMYGPPVRPPQPKLGLSAAFGSGTDWQTSTGEDKYRRGIYTTWRRSNPYPSMATFDAPNREVCTLRRTRTNTPLQALVTLNDPVYVEAAQSVARRMFEKPTLRERLNYGFVLCLLREANEDELDRLEQLYKELLFEYQQAPAQAVAVAEDPLGPLPESYDPAELAALTVIGNVLLNLDEFLMPR